MKVVNDPKETIDNKIGYLEGYIKVKFGAPPLSCLKEPILKFTLIQEADDIKGSSDKIDKKFEALVSEFSIFTGKFKGWAEDKKKLQNTELTNLVKEIEGMQSKLSDLKTALIAVGITAAATLPVTGILACLAGPFAPLVIVSYSQIYMFLGRRKS